MRGLLPAAIRGSEILQVDEDLRAAWRDLLANLAPMATSDDPDAVKTPGYTGPRVWVRGRKPSVGGTGRGMLPDGNSLPQWMFDLCNADSPLLETANNTLTAILRGDPGPNTNVGLLSKVPMAAAALGRSEAIRYLLPNQLRGLMPNCMSLREGVQATDAEALGRAAETLHLALLQSQPIIHLFPAWPKDWDAEFVLLARGNFLVHAWLQSGRVQQVEIESKSRADCRLRNPWTQGDPINPPIQNDQRPKAHPTPPPAVTLTLFSVGARARNEKRASTRTTGFSLCRFCVTGFSLSAVFSKVPGGEFACPWGGRPVPLATPGSPDSPQHGGFCRQRRSRKGLSVAHLDASVAWQVTRPDESGCPWTRQTRAGVRPFWASLATLTIDGEAASTPLKKTADRLKPG